MVLRALKWLARKLISPICSIEIDSFSFISFFAFSITNFRIIVNLNVPIRRLSIKTLEIRVTNSIYQWFRHGLGMQVYAETPIAHLHIDLAEKIGLHRMIELQERKLVQPERSNLLLGLFPLIISRLIDFVTLKSACIYAIIVNRDGVSLKGLLNISEAKLSSNSAIVHDTSLSLIDSQTVRELILIKSVEVVGRTKMVKILDVVFSIDLVDIKTISPYFNSGHTKAHAHLEVSDNEKIEYLKMCKQRRRGYCGLNLNNFYYLENKLGFGRALEIRLMLSKPYERQFSRETNAIFQLRNIRTKSFTLDNVHILAKDEYSSYKIKVENAYEIDTGFCLKRDIQIALTSQFSH
ncbi:hypothetical protein ACOME3_002792 [Neoechinorhynchus agilis]